MSTRSAADNVELSTHILVVATHPFEDGEANHDPNADGLEGRLLTCDDVVVFFDRTEGYSYSRSFAIDAISSGDRCCGVFEDGRLLCTASA